MTIKRGRFSQEQIVALLHQARVYPIQHKFREWGKLNAGQIAIEDSLRAKPRR